MKKIIFLLAMLAGVAASATVTVTPLGVNYNDRTVTFSVEYAAAYNNRAWVWIDLCPVPGVTPGTFQPAEISAVSATGGSVLYASTNTRGFFVTASPATVTATLDNASGKFNWCAYGSDAPPKAETLPDGGYKLYGTPPFTINGNLTEDTKAFGAGTCITTITDLTGNPDGIALLPSLSSPNSPSRCSAGVVTLSVTRSGGTTTAMTYTWNIGGTTYTNTTNSYTTGSISSSRTYSVKVKNANNCESNTVNGTITVNNPGTNGNPYDATCGCTSGTTNCNGTCRTTCCSCSACAALTSSAYPYAYQAQSNCYCFVHSQLCGTTAPMQGYNWENNAYVKTYEGTAFLQCDPTNSTRCK
jgi:hypothetical protein